VFISGVAIFVQGSEFGRTPSGERLARIQASPHYVNDRFQCLEPVEKIVEGSQVEVMWEFLFGSKQGLVPDEMLPTEKTDLKALDIKQDVVVWLGHSSFYMQMGGKRILIDPVFSSYASPLSFINKAFAGSNVYTAEDIPKIDVLIISHDHWDHLDYPTIMALKPKIKEIVCPLGVGEYFEEWGFSLEQIHEEDWFTQVKLAENFSVYVLPAQHFSGRFLKENKALWAGFAFVTPECRVFYSGDTGYGKHFKEIGEMFGGFDLAIMEDGQYNKDWPRIHMMPEETAQAAVDVKATAVLPAHNGKFALSRHAWAEPYKKLVEASEGKNYELITPEIGEFVRIGDKAQQFSHWWEKIK
jgi:L-ascorbate metabolism protein UlaG (beta-lactamase superfamily)